MKTNRHSLMAKGIMVLLTLLILVFVFTYAWFVRDDAPVSANGITASTSSNVSFDVAIGYASPSTGGNYVVTDFASADNAFDFEKLYIPHIVSLGETEIENSKYSKNSSAAEKFNLLDSFRPIDLTGDGVRIYRPAMTNKNRSINYEERSVNEDITENKQYISFDLYIRTDKPDMNVSLDTGSYVVGACELSNTTLAELADGIANNTITPGPDEHGGAYLKTNTAHRLSTYGAFSEDSIVGAVRISFTPYTTGVSTSLSDFFTRPTGTGDYSLDAAHSKLWIPRSDIYLQDRSDLDSNPWTLYTKSDGSAFNGNVTFNDSVSYNDGGTTVSYSVMREAYTGLRDGDITYANAAKKHVYYDQTKIAANLGADTYANRFATVNNPIIDLESDDTSIITVDSRMSDTIDGTTYYYGKCRVTLWIEGCDAEARKANDGGSFLFGFNLKGAI